MTRPALLLGRGAVADALAYELSDVPLLRAHRDSEIPLGTPTVLLALDEADHSAELDVQTQALSADARFILVACDGDEGLVGPQVTRGVPGCISCLRRRQWAARSQRAYLGDALRGPAARRGRGALPAPATGLAALACYAGTIVRRAPVAAGAATRETGGTALVMSLHRLDARWHRFAPVPGCPQCNELPPDGPEAGRLRLLPRPKSDPRHFRVAAVPPQMARLRTELIDERLGVVTRVERQATARQLAYVWALVPSPPEERHALGIGRGFTFGECERVAVLEGLERYAGWSPLARQTAVRGSYRELKSHAVDPAKLALHASDERARPGPPYRPYSPDLEMNWVWGYSFAYDRAVLIPETCAYYRLPASSPGRLHNRFVFEISNGCALGGCREEAILHGLLEVIERDAFLLAWYARGAVRELTREGIADRRIVLMLDNIEADGYRVHVFDVSTEYGVPSLWVMAVHEHGGMPATLSSAGAHFDPEKALLGALIELASMLPSMASSSAQERERGRGLVQDAERVLDMDDHALLYAQPEARERLDFLFDGPPPKSFREAFPAWYDQPPNADLTDDLRALVGRIVAEGQDVWVVDQTPPEARRLGLDVVKVLVPGTLPMTFGHRLRRTEGVARLLTVPQRLGWSGRVLDRSDVNPFPHPFP